MSALWTRNVVSNCSDWWRRR